MVNDESVVYFIIIFMVFDCGFDRSLGASF